ncbi:MAG TPA: DUF998 domain-containing protein [Gammaproteobacteria bacterium]|nr:DUF998 domain-containing protein [Gammaproteobacteria bacterium]
MLTSARVSGVTPWLGRVALIGVLYFFLVSALVQFLRPDYSVMGTPLSFYLLGPYGGWLHGAFYVLAAAILLLAIGCYIGSEPQARTAATLVLFALGAAGVAVTAIFPTDTTATLTRHGVIHVIAAAVAFLATSAAMLIQSWRFRRDPRWRRRFRNAMELAVFEFIVLWYYALMHYPARGFMEKLTIGLILLWLALIAWWLQAPPHGQPQL